MYISIIQYIKFNLSYISQLSKIYWFKKKKYLEVKLIISKKSFMSLIKES